MVAAAVDPWGLRPFTTLRWAIVGVVVALAAAVRPWGRPGGFRLIWLGLLGWVAVAAVTGGDPLIALVGHPRRHLGLVGWLVAALAFAVGTGLTAAELRRHLGRAAVVAGSVTGGDPVSVAAPDTSDLVATGPIELDWDRAEGGLSQVRTHGTLQASDGTVYALSTGPGVRLEDIDLEEGEPRALYWLDDDGTWSPVELDGERPRAVDVAEAGGLLHAVSTGRATGGDGVTAQLSTSSEGGETWDIETVDPPEPPSTDPRWRVALRTLDIESNGSTTLAVLSTSYWPDEQALFPEHAEDMHTGVTVDVREEGVALLGIGDLLGIEEDDPGAPGDVGAGADLELSPDGDEVTSRPPSTTATTELPLDGSEVVAGGDAWLPFEEAEIIDLVTWEELGVEGPEAMSSRVQVFRQTDDGWEPLREAEEALAGLGVNDLVVADEQFVVSGWAGGSLLDPIGEPSETVLFTSSDGISWSPASTPPGVNPNYGSVTTMGQALVWTSQTDTNLHVSHDGGTSWAEVDLVEAGVLDAASEERSASAPHIAEESEDGETSRDEALGGGPGVLVAGSEGRSVRGGAGGPLGLALVTVDPGAEEAATQLAVTGDLVDWTIMPVSEIVGMDDAEIVGVTPVVGEDRIVVTVTGPSPPDPDSPALPPSSTAVGTPVRQG